MPRLFLLAHKWQEITLDNINKCSLSYPYSCFQMRFTCQHFSLYCFVSLCSFYFFFSSFISLSSYLTLKCCLGTFNSSFIPPSFFYFVIAIKFFVISISSLILFPLHLLLLLLLLKHLVYNIYYSPSSTPLSAL